MKLLFVSDIHGSGFYINQLEKIMTKENPDSLIILGDILYHGPRNPLTREYNPKLVLESLNKYSNKIIAVRGNCDSEVDQMVLDFDIMKDYKIIRYNNHQIFITHGHLYDQKNMPKLEENDIFIHGHYHIHNYEKVNDVFYLNPGSLSLPKGDSTNSYGLIEDEIYYIKDLNGKILHKVALC